MTIPPFGCDVRNASAEQRKEFLELLEKRGGHFAYFGIWPYYGINAKGKSDGWYNERIAIEQFGSIIPIEQGIAILKGEEEKPTYTEHEIDFAYLAGVFNVSGIDGLYNEIQRLKSLGKNPHDIIIEGRNPPKQ
ncbi:MAG: hypothetical protein BWY67_00735 [Bacteroidetes bacterium ADurb.Bin397]|nr:MAG: hypothetical protein BWY67_00735 [Bacteroidetes bacterium ADurb.Bin397]